MAQALAPTSFNWSGELSFMHREVQLVTKLNTVSCIPSIKQSSKNNFHIFAYSSDRHPN
jgi:hypothetical protein